MIVLGRSANPFGTCNKCGARILWIQTKAGKSMPVNPRILTYRSRKGAKERIVTPNGEVHSADIVESGTPDATGIGYISHFATCTGYAQRGKR